MRQAGGEEKKPASLWCNFFSSEVHCLCAGKDETNPADQVINSEKTTDPKIVFSQDDATPQEFPKCDSGCVETLLGLKNILLPSEDLFTFLKVFF